MNCKYCGGSIAPGSGKCPNCGARINLADGGQTFYDSVELDEWEVSEPIAPAAPASAKAESSRAPVSSKSGGKSSKKKKKGMSGNKFIILCIAVVLAFVLAFVGILACIGDEGGGEYTCENCYGSDHKTDECPHKVNINDIGGGDDPKAPGQKDPPSKGGEVPDSGRTDNDIFNKLPSRNEKTESNVCGICGDGTHVRKAHPCKECDKKGHEGNCKDACQICGYDMHKTEDHPKCEVCGKQDHELCCSYCYKNHGKVRTDHKVENCPAKKAAEAKKCATCGSTAHTTENHPKKTTTEKCATCGSTAHTTENHPKKTTTQKKQTTTTQKQTTTSKKQTTTTTEKKEPAKQTTTTTNKQTTTTTNKQTTTTTQKPAASSSSSSSGTNTQKPAASSSDSKTNVED